MTEPATARTVADDLAATETPVATSGDLDTVEVDEADAVEQRAEIVPEGDDPIAEIPLDVDPADAVEQRRAVEGDDDDYR